MMSAYKTEEEDSKRYRDEALHSMDISEVIGLLEWSFVGNKIQLAF
jgi:hypothetical protein